MSPGTIPPPTPYPSAPVAGPPTAQITSSSAPDMLPLTGSSTPSAPEEAPVTAPTVEDNPAVAAPSAGNAPPVAGPPMAQNAVPSAPAVAQNAPAAPAVPAAPVAAPPAVVPAPVAESAAAEPPAEPGAVPPAEAVPAPVPSVPAAEQTLPEEGEAPSSTSAESAGSGDAPAATDAPSAAEAPTRVPVARIPSQPVIPADGVSTTQGIAVLEGPQVLGVSSVPGGPRPSVDPDGPAATVIALDVGGTDIKGAVLDSEGILHRIVRPTRAKEGPEVSLNAVVHAIAELEKFVPADKHAVGVGLAVPGTVDDVEGRVVSAENLGWVDLPVRDIIADAVDLPVGFGHDVRTAGLAEWRLGAGQNAENMMFISIGTGIAAAVVINGRIVTGGGYAGEIGHGGSRDGELCVCGGRGCAETFASAAGIARRYRERTGVALPGSKEVLDLAKGGDPVAQSVWDQAVDRIAFMISEAVRLLGVRRVVVGGGLVRAGTSLMTPLGMGVSAYLTIHPRPELVPARLGSDAGTYGAALLGWRAAGVRHLQGWARALAPSERESPS